MFLCVQPPPYPIRVQGQSLPGAVYVARPVRGRHRARQLSSGGAWEMKADLIQQVFVPPHIVSTRLRPDMLLWSDLEKIVYFFELSSLGRQS